ncbi:hypothetical protein PoB_005868500 [Plakobranchus ocellatus]|uniref:Uncharacterized protein n=1 Tax=Plakobranchus ocellatus TaxID=259542 RepID=A0AAV4CJZ9_9GAST|nr:hypothetical protein PoB_005868500 [Plakobranchus ocellatus]
MPPRRMQFSPPRHFPGQENHGHQQFDRFSRREKFYSTEVMEVLVGSFASIGLGDGTVHIAPQGYPLSIMPTHMGMSLDMSYQWSHLYRQESALGDMAAQNGSGLAFIQR